MKAEQTNLGPARRLKAPLKTQMEFMKLMIFISTHFFKLCIFLDFPVEQNV